MKYIGQTLLIFTITTSTFAGVCTDSIGLKNVFLSEKRVEVVTKVEGVTLDLIIKCLRANADQVGDFKFEKPSKEEGAKVFPKGKTVVVSRDEYDPHHWIFSYRHNSEHLSDSSDTNDVRLLQLSQTLKITRKNRQSENVSLDVFGGLVLTRAHLIEPDSDRDAANDAAPTAGLRYRIRTAPRQEFHFGLDADRFYIIDQHGDDRFIYRGHLRLGWEGMLTDQLTIGLNGALNSLVEDGGLGYETGLHLKYRIDNFYFSLGSQYETVALDDATVRGFAHAFSLEILFWKGSSILLAKQCITTSMLEPFC